MMPDITTKRKWRPWPPEDDLLLKQIYPTAKSSELVRIFDRSIGTIRVRASVLDIKRCTGASSSEKSASAYRRYDNEDAVVYQPAIQKNEMSEAEFKRYELVATMKSNAQALNCAGMSWLASITGAIAEQIKSAKSLKKLGFLTSGGHMNEIDQTYDNACAIVRASGKVSISYLQRMMLIGYNRAARYIEKMELNGIVTAADYSGKREVILNNKNQNQL